MTGSSCDAYEGFYGSEATSCCYLLAKKGCQIDQRIEIHKLLSNIPRTPKILDVLEINETNIKYFGDSVRSVGQQILVLEMINGKRLSDYLKNTLNFRQIFNMIQQLLQTIQLLRKLNIYHLDVRPENIIITNQDEPYLIDFGNAIQCKTKQNMANNVIKGPHNVVLNQKLNIRNNNLFFPPKYEHEEYCPNKCDQYSVGCILYLALTKKYLCKPIKRFSRQMQDLIHEFGFTIADLLGGLCTREGTIRYDVDLALSHPIFQVTQLQDFKRTNLISLAQFHFNYQSLIRKILFKNNPIKRSFSVYQSRNIIQIKPKEFCGRSFDDNNLLHCLSCQHSYQTFNPFQTCCHMLQYVQNFSYEYHINGYCKQLGQQSINKFVQQLSNRQAVDNQYLLKKSYMFHHYRFLNCHSNFITLNLEEKTVDIYEEIQADTFDFEHSSKDITGIESCSKQENSVYKLSFGDEDERGQYCRKSTSESTEY